MALTRATTTPSTTERRTRTARRWAGVGGTVWSKPTAKVEPTSRAGAGHAARTTCDRRTTGEVTTTLKSGFAALKPVPTAVKPVRARPPLPLLGMQPMNGWKLVVPPPERVRAAWKT